MDIRPEEVESVTTVGDLFGTSVKMVKCIGGFYVAIGKKKKNARKAEAIAVGSHQAIVAHQLQKDYGSDFEPALAKSEHDRLEDVENKTEYLSNEDIEKGIELFTLTKNEKIEFVLYSRGRTLGRYEAEAVDDTLVLKKHEFNIDKANKKTAAAISRAMRDKAHELGLSKIRKNG